MTAATAMTQQQSRKVALIGYCYDLGTGRFMFKFDRGLFQYWWHIKTKPIRRVVGWLFRKLVDLLNKSIFRRTRFVLFADVWWPDPATLRLATVERTGDNHKQLFSLPLVR